MGDYDGGPVGGAAGAADDAPDGDGERHSSRGGRGRRWLVAGLVVIAAVAGGAGGYLVRAQTTPAVVAAPPAPEPAPPAPADPGRSAGPSPCLEVAQRGTDLVTQLERAVRAVGDLDPAALRAVLDEVRVLRDELQAEVAACRDQA
ncbi:hypothetical protein ACL02T_32315 [Pseudonocardia sp. RS010]|uniref:hypothetical protein n=1 Tax=Pseudonocardia sp. RS010 TaxID=3385979 RepID=UPI0039A2EEAA